MEQELDKSRTSFFYSSKLPLEDISNTSKKEDYYYLRLPSVSGVCYEEEALSSKYIYGIAGFLPEYKYEISICDSPNIAKSSEVLTDKLLEMLQKLIDKESLDIRNSIVEITKSTKVGDIFDNLTKYFGEERAGSFLSRIGISAIDYGYNLFVFDNKLEGYELKESITFNQKDNFIKMLEDSLKLATPDKNKDQLKAGLIDLLKQHSALVYSAKNNEEVSKIIMGVSSEIINEEFSKEDLLSVIDRVDRIRSLKNKVTNEFNAVTGKNKIKMPRNIKDVDALKMINSDLGGSTASAKCYESESGEEYFVLKELKNQTACKSEYEAYQVYNAFGVKVPQHHLIEDENRTILVTEYIAGEPVGKIEEKLKEKDSLNELRDEISDGFVIDVLIGNYDSGTIHCDNFMISKEDGQVYRIDPGAALQFDHKGLEKGSQYAKVSFIKWDDDVVRDFTVWREGLYGKKSAFVNYGGISNQEILDKLHDAVDHMPKVKLVASPKNFEIIEKRLEKALLHFTELCKMELDIHQEVKALSGLPTEPKAKEEPTSKIKVFLDFIIKPSDRLSLKSSFIGNIINKKAKAKPNSKGFH